MTNIKSFLSKVDLSNWQLILFDLLKLNGAIFAVMVAIDTTGG